MFPYYLIQDEFKELGGEFLSPPNSAWKQLLPLPLRRRPCYHLSKIIQNPTRKKLLIQISLPYDLPYDYSKKLPCIYCI